MFECRLEPPPGGLAARRVAVETEHHALGHCSSRRCTLVGVVAVPGGDGVLHAKLGQGDDIHVAFDHDHRFLFADRAPGLHPAVEFASLLEQRRLGEFRYFGSPLSRIRPPKPMILPRWSWMGNTMRSRNRS